MKTIDEIMRNGPISSTDIEELTPFLHLMGGNHLIWDFSYSGEDLHLQVSGQIGILRGESPFPSQNTRVVGSGHRSRSFQNNLIRWNWTTLGKKRISLFISSTWTFLYLLLVSDREKNKEAVSEKLFLRVKKLHNINWDMPW